MTDNDFERRLRASLAAHATQAPDEHGVVQQVLRDVQVRREPNNTRWRTWTVPLIAAAAVAAVAAAIVGVQNYHPTAGHHGTPAVTQGDSSPAPVTTSAPTVSESPQVTTTSHPVLNVVGLTHFAVNDLTFVGPSAWAWGTADCLPGQTGQGGVCPAMVHSGDGGVHWKSMAGPPANIPVLTCNEPCVHEIRFANSDTGYAFGPNTLYMTSDAGKSWTLQKGGATALETLDGNVIRASTTCSPGCAYTVQTAPIGGTSWTTRSLPGSQPNMASGATLIRVAGSAYLDIYGHTSGGAQNATSTLFVSHDDGATWTNRGEPCKQIGPVATGNESDSTAIAAGGDSFAVLCADRSASADSLVGLSSDAGASYHRGAGHLANAPGGLLAVSGNTVLADTTDGLFRSTDRGDTWRQVNVPGLGSARWLGFESVTDARVVNGDGSTIWTTHDAGAHWTSITFP